MVTYLPDKSTRTAARPITVPDLFTMVASAPSPAWAAVQRELDAVRGGGSAQAAGRDRLDAAKRALPIVIVGCVWPDADASKGRPHRLSGMVCIDFDDVDQVADVDAELRKLRGHPHVLLAFRSPSRTGIKVIVPISGAPAIDLVDKASEGDYQAHVRASFWATYARAGRLVGVPVPDAIGGADMGAKAPEAPCFVPHDPDAVYNPDAVPVPWQVAPAPKVRTTTAAMPTSTDLDEAERLRRLLVWSRRKQRWDRGHVNRSSYAFAIRARANLISEATTLAALCDLVPEDSDKPNMPRQIRCARTATLDEGHAFIVNGRPRLFSVRDPFEVHDMPPPPDMDADAHTTDAHTDADAQADAPRTGLRRRTLAEIHKAAREYPVPMLTGIDALDEAMGIRPGGMVLVGAEPGAGKTMFLLNVLLSMARTQPDRSFVYYSAELTAREALMRLVLCLSGKAVGGMVPSYLGSDLSLSARIAGEPILRDHRQTFVRNAGELLADLWRRAGAMGITFDELISKARSAQEAHAAGRAAMALLDALGRGQAAADELVGAGRIVIASDDDQLIKLTELAADMASPTKPPLGAVVVDYATQIDPGDDARELRERAISVSRALTAITRKGSHSLWVASQISRESVARTMSQTERKEREFRAKYPGSHRDAIGGGQPPHADVFVESAQWHRDADVALLLHNPAQGAQRADDRYLGRYQKSGLLPLFVRVLKQRGGPGGHVIALGMDLAAQAIHSALPMPSVAGLPTDTKGRPRWFTREEREKKRPQTEPRNKNTKHDDE